MTKAILIGLLSAIAASAAPVITGGSIQVSSGPLGSQYSISLLGPGLNVAFSDNRAPLTLPAGCTGTCTYNYSQSGTFSLFSGFNPMVEGINYNLVVGTLEITFVSSIASGTATCSGCGGPVAPEYTTNFASAPFTATGTLTLRDPAQLNTPVVYSQSFTAQGTATGGVVFSPRQFINPYVTYSFSSPVPEPATWSLGLVGVAVLIGFRKRRS